jgi:hypothetical protein
MGLFQTKTLDKPDNMISAGVILTPSVLTSSSQETYTRAPNRPAINPPAPQSVTPQNATTKIPGRNINFVENYKNWCVSPVLNNIYKQEIKLPIIRFKEYRLLTSTLWEQAKYFAFIYATAPGRLAEDVSNFLGPGDEGNADAEPNYIVEGLNKTQEAIDTAFGRAKELVESFDIKTPDFERASDEDPYEGIYSPEKTGFEYTFPYYTSFLKSKDSRFGDTYSGDGKGALPTFLDSILSKADSPSYGARALVEPGVFIEKTQFYQFKQDGGESISFSFPLLNTISQEQINENYQFLFLLIYQNTMYRKDRSAFIPPCIYEVLVPGTRYMKWAHISRLSIDFIGTRRMIEVDSGIGVFKTIVPEAYNVNITVTGLHEEAGNFLIRSSANNFSEIKIRDMQYT